VLLAGCSFPSPPHSSIIAIEPVRAPVNGTLAAVKEQTVGVLYSADTGADLDYLRRYHRHALSSLEGHLLMAEIRQGYADSAQAQVTLTAIEQSISRHLPKAQFYPDQAALDQASPNIIVIVHMHHVLLTSRTSEVRADYVADFFDRSYRYLGRAEAHQALTMPALWTQNQRTEQIVSQLEKQQALQGRAMDEFDASLSRLAR
jgi:hypothetical protein